MQGIKSVSGRVGATVSALGTLMVMGFILGGPASATVDPIDTAFTDMQGKVTTYGAAIVALVVASALIFLGIKFLRKGLSKA